MKIKQRLVEKTKLKVDILGLGSAPLGGNFVDLTYEDGAKIIKAALQSGMSYFDTAAWYGFGRSERLVGDPGSVVRTKYLAMSYLDLGII